METRRTSATGHGEEPGGAIGGDRRAPRFDFDFHGPAPRYDLRRLPDPPRPLPGLVERPLRRVLDGGRPRRHPRGRARLGHVLGRAVDDPAVVRDRPTSHPARHRPTGAHPLSAGPAPLLHPGRMDRLIPRTRQLAGQLLDDLQGASSAGDGVIDVSGYCRLLPAMVFSEYCGFPTETQPASTTGSRPSCSPGSTTSRLPARRPTRSTTTSAT